MNDTKQTVWVLRHTAGHDKHGQSVVYDEANGRDIAIVYDGDTDGPLIAAIPELLAEAKQLLRNAKFQDGHGTILTQDAEALEEAIARAEGL